MDHFLLLLCDISDYSLVQQKLKQPLEQWGRADILVNNAGLNRGAFFLDRDPLTWNRLIREAAVR